jgi:crotonobetainyl-CoA:carnitine CoA-transferase CaiB-like acyl-CoA transferase
MRNFSTRYGFNGEKSMANGFLFDVRVIELGDERVDFCGKLFAGAGADVIKVEPPGGGPSRSIGPFYKDTPHPDRSLFFWHYNLAKRGVTLDIGAPQGSDVLRKLIGNATVLLDSTPLDTLENLGLDWAALQKLNPGLVYVRITSFGRSGPWRDFKGTDLVHLALGGEMMLCGYDPKPDGIHDTPPIAPQVWHAWHITGNQAFIAALGALIARADSGVGDMIDMPVHHAVSVCTEVDVPYWVYAKQACVRQTGRHAFPIVGPPSQHKGKDGRYSNVVANPFPGGRETMIAFLKEIGQASDLNDDKYKDPANLAGIDFVRHFGQVQANAVAAFGYEDVWRKAQDRGIPWVPVRHPDENLNDEQWQIRGTFGDVHHPEVGETLRYGIAPTRAEECPWRMGPRAPLVGEHNEAVFCDELGLTREELRRLKDSHVI